MIGSISNEYRKYEYDWKRINDFVDGERTVKEVGYVQIPEGITDDKKKIAYINRGFFPELADTALNEANGRIFQQNPVLPEKDLLSGLGEDFYNNVDGAGTSLLEMLAKVVNNLNKTTRCAILVDYAGQGIFRNEYERANSSDRIVWTFYDTLEIYSVKTDITGKIVKVELGEQIQDDYIGLNSSEEIYPARRILYIEDGIYKQAIFKEENINGKSQYVQYGEEIIPLMNGKTLDYIPLMIFNGKTNNHEVYKPRLLNMVETINSIYQNWTDLEHMIYNICTPVRYGTGINQEDLSNIREAGPTKFWALQNPEANLGVLDIQGTGLDFVFRNISDKLKIAERLGYVFMDSGAKTATQSILETTGRVITLTDVANSANAGINKALEISAMWMNINYNPEKMEVRLNVKTDCSSFEANNFIALINAYSAGLARKRDVHKYEIERKITNEQNYDKWNTELEDNIMELNPDVIE